MPQLVIVENVLRDLMRMHIEVYILLLLNYRPVIDGMACNERNVKNQSPMKIDWILQELFRWIPDHMEFGWHWLH